VTSKRQTRARLQKGHFGPLFFFVPALISWSSTD